jgi:hypothetical protein
MLVESYEVWISTDIFIVACQKHSTNMKLFPRQSKKVEQQKFYDCKTPPAVHCHDTNFPNLYTKKIILEDKKGRVRW